MSLTMNPTINPTMKKTQPPPAANEPPLSIQISRMIRAPRERVFAAWTQPELLRQWFAPGAMIVAGARTAAAPGGDYRIEMLGSPDCADIDPAQRENPPAVQGVYREITPYSLISFTWLGDWRPNEESLVTIRLSEAEGGTLLELTQQGFLTKDSQNGHDRGWNSSLSKLANLLEQ